MAAIWQLFPSGGPGMVTKHQSIAETLLNKKSGELGCFLTMSDMFVRSVPVES